MGLLLTGLLVVLAAATAKAEPIQAKTMPLSPSPWQKEILYQIFPISFRDSNGDGFGDFKGIQEELPFLKRLGITAILVNPIFKSRFYHKYFADDFMTVDPAFGTNDDWFDLVRAAHGTGLKVVLDMEVQYVADQHPWLRERPDYFWKSPSIYTSAPLEGYDGQKIQLTAVDPANPEVQKAIQDVFTFWAKPDGDLSAGVDGFRIDHMMDDFDNQHIKQNMLASFWAPIIRSVRSTRPKSFFLAEQADWGAGADYFTKADVDAVHDFPLWVALNQKGAPEIDDALRAGPPKGKTVVNFIEIHDTERWATHVNSNPNALRMAAVLNLTAPGTPLIYQGQELGMKGKPAQGSTDGNDIPQRLGYRWSKSADAKGTPSWYVGHVPQETLDYSRTGDGISVEDEMKDPASLINFYRKLIRLRRSKAVLQTGVITVVPMENTAIVAYKRRLPGRKQILVVLNPFKKPASATWPEPAGRAKTLIGGGDIVTKGGSRRIKMGSYGYWILELG